jgi:RND family efflux transporter MFP subunit
MGDAVMTRSRTICAAIALALLVACSRPAPEAPKAEPLEPRNVTHWTETTELYMEYPPLVAGQSALFAVHLTRLGSFQALDNGHARIEFSPSSGGAPTVLTGGEPSRPGAFRVEGKPPAAGPYRWTLVVDAPSVQDRHDLGTVTVYPDDAAARKASATGPTEDATAIAYLKEQQWTNEFATAAVRDGELRRAIRVPASLQPLTGGEAIVSAPASGRFTATALVSIGAVVRAGQELGRLEPRLAAGDDRATLAAAVAEARAVLDAAKVEEDRATRLLADRAVPARRVDDAHRAVAVAEARLQAAEARLAQRDETLRTGGGVAAGNAFTLRAPIAGRVADVMATLGASYDEGAPLFKIVRTDELELQALVPAADAPLPTDITTIALELPGRSEPVEVRPHHMHDAGVIDAETRALTVQFEVDNPGGRLLVGQSGTAVLFTGQRLRMPVVPRAAVLMEAGRPYVFVQVGGERFARRYVEIGGREGDVIGLRSGVTIGDRVVTRGAYEVQLASAAKGLPAEGHVH